MKILLINPFSSFKSAGVPFKLPNTSLATVYAIIKQAENEADLCDFQILDEPDLKLIDHYLDQKRYDIIGITVSIDVLEHVSQLITYIKEKNANTPIIIGGPPLLYQPELWLRETGADVAVIGEAELTIPELFPAIKSQSDLRNIKGIIYRSNGQFIRTQSRPRLKQLDQSPFPDYSLYDLEAYFRNPNFRWLFNDKRGLYLMSSRGCPYRCAYCCSGGGIRTYKTNQIILEIKLMIERYKLESIFVRDDIFTYNQERARAISEFLGETGISWACMTRPNLLCRKGDKQLIELMAANGCETIMIGVESYNQKVLDLNLKDVRISEIDQAIENCQASGLRIITFIIFGLPGETEESIKRNFEFIKKHEVEISANILQPLPGSKIYDDAIKQGGILDEVQYLKDFHFFWDREDYLPVNMTELPDEMIIQANIEAGKLRTKPTNIRHS
ncbi:MAG: radical SAM protein [Candidatus Theseobacter exili]|nr:radical SAM protein [Candidatus Theseobacter exili]